jgi:MerR family transcriptional regulator, light-induced transcriptional regulator
LEKFYFISHLAGKNVTNFQKLYFCGMQVFNIRDIENLTGIKAHTLRIWEQRYERMMPERKIGSHRTYSNEDLKHLLKISLLYHHGYKISKIAALGKDQINKLTMDTLVVKDPFLLYVNQLFEASVDFDEERFEKILHTCILHYSFERCLFRVLFPFLAKMGLLWSTGNVVPSMEHFASNLIIRKLAVAAEGLERPVKKEPVVLLFTPEMEMHEIPLLTMHYLMKKNKVQSVLFGTGISLDTLSIYCSTRPVTHLYAHIITYLHHVDIEEYVASLSSRFHNKQIVLAGAVVQSMQRSFVNVRILKNEEEMIAFSRM